MYNIKKLSVEAVKSDAKEYVKGNKQLLEFLNK